MAPIGGGKRSDGYGTRIMTATLDRQPPRDPGEVRTLPLTDTQAGLLVGHRSAHRALYNVLVEFEIDARVSVEQLRQACADVLAVQPSLRCTLHELPAPHAVLHEPVTAGELPWLEVRAPAAELSAAVRHHAEQLGRIEFDLQQPPLVQWRSVAAETDDGVPTSLLLCVHHTVFDGWSIDAVVRDLSAALDRTLDPASLAPRREAALVREVTKARSLADAQDTHDRARSWAQRLNAVAPLVLYPLPDRSVDTDFGGRRRAIQTDQQLACAVKARCEELLTTPFSFFSALFAATVARHGGAPTVVLGTPVVSRRSLAAFDLCGLFVNTLPLIVDVDVHSRFDTFLRDTVASQVEAVRRDADVPWPQIVRHAAPDRSSTRNALFSCMIAMQDSTVITEGSAVRAVREHGTGTAKFDLWLGVTLTPEGWLLEIEHDTRLIPPEIAAGIERSLLTALRRAVTESAVTVAELFDDQRQPADQLDIAPREQAESLAGQLWRALASHGDRAAVRDGDRAISYAELHDDALLTASGLAAGGVTAGDVVGLATTRLGDTVRLIAATLRLGAAFVPLDYGLPAERMAYMIERSGCRVIVGDSPGVAAGATTVAALMTAGRDAGQHALAADPDTDESPVYIMFTSGSTGQPKGVQMHGRPLNNLTRWQIAALGQDQHTRFLQYAPLGFDVSFQEILPTLVSGGCVVARTAADRRELSRVARQVEQDRLTHIYLPVAALRSFCLAGTDWSLPMAALRVVCVSGEQLYIDADIRRFFADRPQLTLINLYGPTETHAVTTYSMSGDPAEWPDRVPIGRPIDAVSAQVIDLAGRLAPPGVPGELLLGGQCPALGYVNDPEQTAGQFIEDPYVRGGRRYRTGDSVLWDVAGQLVFLGRNDDQVKIRGHRVELGEVEAAGLLLPGVREAAAVAVDDRGERALLLCVTVEPGTEDIEAGALAGRLPGYMVPAATLTVPAIPRTENGKIDRRQLAATAARQLQHRREAADGSGGAMPSDALETGLVELWSDILGCPPIGVDADLLALGAHSLNVLQAVAQIESDHGVSVTIVDFFRNPTVRSLADMIRSEQR
jgi:amino acid adenylation domain-containing protein